MAVYLALYKGRSSGLSRLGLAIVRYITKSQYSHCEIIRDYRCYKVGITSSPSEGGVVRRKIHIGDDWDTFRINEKVWDAANDLWNREHGARYDWIGLLRFVIPILNSNSKTRWFCSEFCATVMGLEDPWTYSPASLASFVMSQGDSQDEV